MARDFGFEPRESGEYYFISYNSEDADRVAEICRSMNNDGVSLWYDNGLHYGEKWESEIANRLQNAKAVILFFSKGILEKENSYVKIEYDTAEIYKKTIFVVFLDYIDSQKVPSSKILWYVKICQHQSIPVQNHTNEYCKEIYKAIDVSNSKIVQTDTVCTTVHKNITPITAYNKPIHYQTTSPTANKTAALSKPKSKKTAIVLCIFFGLLGVHKFYEGKYLIGFVYIILFVLNFTIIITFILAIIDLIKLIKKPDTYYIEKRKK